MPKQLGISVIKTILNAIIYTLCQTTKYGFAVKYIKYK